MPGEPPPPPLPTPSPYPGWQPAPPPPRPRSRWLVIGVAGVVLAVVAALAVIVLRSAVHLGSTTVALAAPATIQGMPKTADYSSQPVSVFGQHVLDIASATYGAGDVRYAVVAISEPSGNRRDLVQMMAPQYVGDARADPASTTHLRRSGIDYTCSRLAGSVSGATCTWDDSGVAGVVVQIGSDDLGHCADFADVARTAVRRG